MIHVKYIHCTKYKCTCTNVHVYVRMEIKISLSLVEFIKSIGTWEGFEIFKKQIPILIAAYYFIINIDFHWGDLKNATTIFIQHSITCFYVYIKCMLCRCTCI